MAGVTAALVIVCAGAVAIVGGIEIARSIIRDLDAERRRRG